MDLNTKFMIASSLQTSQKDLARITDKICMFLKLVILEHNQADDYAAYLESGDASLIADSSHVLYNCMVGCGDSMFYFEAYNLGDAVLVGLDENFNVIITCFGDEPTYLFQEAVENLRKQFEDVQVIPTTLDEAC